MLIALRRHYARHGFAPCERPGQVLPMPKGSDECQATRLATLNADAFAAFFSICEQAMPTDAWKILPPMTPFTPCWRW